MANSNPREIRKQFGIGIRRFVAGEIWNRILSWCPEDLKSEELAFYLGYSADSYASVFRGLKKGDLTLESLITMLIINEKQWEHLPPLPPKQKLIMAGYGRALVYYRYGRKAVRDDEPSEAEIQCLAHLFKADNRWLIQSLNNISKKANDTERDRINTTAMAIVKQAEDNARKPLAFRLKQPPQSAAAFLKELNENWGKAYLCVCATVKLEVQI